MTFSKDGQSVAYVSYPEAILWKANKDGSRRVQLTDDSLQAIWDSWSPDGTQILFMAASPQGSLQGWIVSSQGGAPRRILPDSKGQETDPSWSLDGSKILYATNTQMGPSKESEIRTLDVATKKVTTLPGSEGMFSPHWSPNGRYIFASSLSLANLYLFDTKTQRWSTLYKGIFAYATWSSDSRSIYFFRYASEPAVLLISATGGDAQVVVNLKDFRYAGTLGLWFGLDPSDAPLLLRDEGTSDVYALTLEEK